MIEQTFFDLAIQLARFKQLLSRDHQSCKSHTCRLKFDETQVVFQISIVFQTFAKRRLNLVWLCPDRLKAIVYQVNQIGDLGKAVTNPIAHQQQPNRLSTSEIRPQFLARTALFYYPIYNSLKRLIKSKNPVLQNLRFKKLSLFSSFVNQTASVKGHFI